MPRAVDRGPAKGRRAKPQGAAERRLSMAAEGYAQAHKEIERRYARLVAAVRETQDSVTRRRAAELTGLSRSRIQQIVEEERG